MSDAGLRELERRWRASGAPGDEARVLAERLRQGALSRERLELAAHVGHVAAREALGVVPAGRLPLARWVALLDDAGRVALLRSGRDDALARLGAAAAPLSPNLASAGLALQVWCACPCADHARAVREARPAARPLELDAALAEQARALLAHALRTLCDAAAACGLDEDDRDALLELVLGDTLRVGVEGADATGGTGATELPPTCSLVGWALGEEHAASPRSLATAPDATRRYLQDRLDRGELSPERLALAAYAGDADAAGLSDEPFVDTSETTDVHAWVVGLARFAPDLPARAVARLASRSLSQPLSSLARRREPTLERLEGATLVFDLARQLGRWADQPAAERRDAVERLAAQLDAHLDGLPRHLRGRAAALRALVEAAAAATGRRTPDEALLFVLDALDDVAAALASLRAAVAGWALG